MEETNFMQEMIKAVGPVILVIVPAMVTWGLAELSRWIRSKTKNENVNYAMDQVSSTITTIVAELQQTVREAMADGKITKEEAEKIKAIAMQKVTAQVPLATQKLAKLAVNSLDDYISSRIEQEVLYLKNGRYA